MKKYNQPARIYVACLAAYNSGVLHGEWIDLDECSFDKDTVQGEIQKMLSKSPREKAEEWAIHDYEGLHNISEYEKIEEICKQGELFDEYGVAAKVLLPEVMSVEEAKNILEDGYSIHESYEDYALQYAEECLGLELPNFLVVDWDRTGRDLAMDKTVIRSCGELYFFNR